MFIGGIKMKTDTEKAIDYIEMIMVVVSDLKEMKSEPYIERLDQVITLLKQGEAYRRIVERMSEIYKGHEEDGVYNDIETLKQKYLKEV